MGRFLTSMSAGKMQAKRRNTNKYAKGTEESKKRPASSTLFTQASVLILSKISGDESPQFFSMPEKEEGKEAALDRAANFIGFLLEAAPCLRPQLADSESSWPPSQGYARSTGHPYSSHGWRAEAVWACAT